MKLELNVLHIICLVIYLLIGVHYIITSVIETIHEESWIRSDICFFGYHNQLCDHRVRFVFFHSHK